MKQTEIWLINLDPTIGSEINKTRPGIIINDDNLGVLPLKIIVPITDWKEKFVNTPWMVKITPSSKNNLIKLSTADCFQIRSISNERLVRKIGIINETELFKIKIGISKVLNINPIS